MESFIEDLLNLHMMRTGSFQLSNYPFNLEEAIAFVCDMIKLKASEKGIIVVNKHIKQLPDLEDQNLVQQDDRSLHFRI